MKNKGFFISIGILFSFFGCSQNVKETYKIQPAMNTIQNPHINASNIVEELIKEVKHYPKEPMYYISYGAEYCFFEVLVNDIPVYKEFQYPGGNSAFDINQAIMRNGTQKVTFRLYPVGKIEDNPNTYTTLINETDLELRIKLGNNSNKNEKVVIVKEYRTSRIPNPDKRFTDSIFAFTGKDYYEDSFSFEAQVPYTLQNFEKVKDLRRMDKRELETRLLKKYEEMKNIYQSKNLDNIARISFDKLKNEQISYYYDEKGAEEMWDNMVNIFSQSSFEMQPIENYELKYLADGKLVALMLKTEDNRLKGNTVLWAKSKANENTRVFTFNAYFYILEGENDFRVY